MISSHPYSPSSSNLEMNSPTTPRATFTFAVPEVKQFWHPLAKSAGLGWMKRTDVVYLDMFFDIREYVLQDMSEMAQEIDFLILRRLIPRPLSYPAMEKMNDPPPDGFRRISMRYNMTDNPKPLENSMEDIMPALRKIRDHLKKLSSFEGPFRPFELRDPDLFRQFTLLKFDFYPALPESCPSPDPEQSFLTASQSTITPGLDASIPDLSDCSSFVEGFRYSD